MSCLGIISILLSDESLHTGRVRRQWSMYLRHFLVFYPRDALHSAVFAVVRCSSVCTSVCHTPVLCLGLNELHIWTKFYRPAFQGHSRSSTVTQIDQGTLTSCEWCIVTMIYLVQLPRQTAILDVKWLLNFVGALTPSPTPFISFKNTIIQAIEMTHEQDN